MRRFFASAALAVASTLVALAAGELVVRALYKDQTVMFPRYHTDYRYGRYTLRGVRPNAEFRHSSVDGTWTFVTNSRGFRNTREFAYAKPADVLRVLSLGDSHTQGHEARQEATFSAVLERYLEKRSVHAEVLNAGVSGFSTAEALAFLENEGYKYQPDVVVLGFYANDFEDNVKTGLFALEAGRLVERKFEHLPGVRIQNAIYAIPGAQWLSENSYLYSLAFNGLWMHFKSALAGRGRAEFEFAVATKGRHSDKEVALAVALLERMRDFCERRGIRLIVVDIPRPNRHATPSLSPGVVPGIELVASGELLREFEGAAELHVAHGNRHISELTHALIGIELGRRIFAPVQKNYAPAEAALWRGNAAPQQ
ncbi:MAG TPA: GDSL-type esterase/lipase family protein [Burkholderiales bacterium]|nr:GDSL-type esterase/lipase family protein [Burkholderiales bacterium]